MPRHPGRTGGRGARGWRSAHVLHIEEPEGTNFVALFDRGDDFTALLAEVAQVREMLTAETVQDVLKQVRKLRKAFANLVEIDFFPGEAQRQTDTALRELELACARALSPDEPQAVDGVIERLELSDYQGRTWATRRRPWVDRLASAWLIRRFIDPQARILWLDSPDDCPPDALGFDFDGATFSHVGSRVTFEVLAASFGLEQAAIARLGLLVHCLDVGGIQPPEAVGIECARRPARNPYPRRFTADCRIRCIRRIARQLRQRSIHNVTTKSLTEDVVLAAPPRLVFGKPFASG